ncbi:MAG: hypothetical protein WC869_10615 [Phycisphaerae bacterium]|jgi:hypothetical protein
MAKTLVIEVEGKKELLALFAAGPIVKLQRDLLLASGEILRGYLAVNPGPPRYPLVYASQKQRLFLLIAWRKGEIEQPYHRDQSSTSERLRLHWVTRITGDQVGYVSNPVSYAGWVQGAENQQPMHRNTGWITDEQAVDQAEKSNDIDEAWAQLCTGWLGG